MASGFTKSIDHTGWRKAHYLVAYTEWLLSLDSMRNALDGVYAAGELVNKTALKLKSYAMDVDCVPFRDVVPC